MVRAEGHGVVNLGGSCLGSVEESLLVVADDCEGGGGKRVVLYS